MNDDIKQYAKDRGVFLWRIAAELGINDGNFSRKLRKKLSREERGRIISIIDRLSVGSEATESA